MTSTFHISIPCLDIEKTKNFYVTILGGKLGRQTNNWIDIDFWGNQITFVKSGNYDFKYKNYTFEGKTLPSFHFGVILMKDDWEILYHKIKPHTKFYLDKNQFLPNKKGQHSSFFITDPNGFVIEFKSFDIIEDIFSVMKTIFIEKTTLTREIIKLLIKKYPHGYNYSDVISWKHQEDKYVKIIQVDNGEIRYNIKIGQYLDDLMEKFNDDEEYLNLSNRDFDSHFDEFLI